MSNDNDLPTNRQWNQFQEYMREHGLFTAEYQRYDPTPIPFNIKADIFVNSDAPDTPTIENRVKTALNNLFKKGSGSLGLVSLLLTLTIPLLLLQKASIMLILKLLI